MVAIELEECVHIFLHQSPTCPHFLSISADQASRLLQS